MIVSILMNYLLKNRSTEIFKIKWHNKLNLRKIFFEVFLNSHWQKPTDWHLLLDNSSCFFFICSQTHEEGYIHRKECTTNYRRKPFSKRENLNKVSDELRLDWHSYLWKKKDKIKKRDQYKRTNLVRAMRGSSFRTPSRWSPLLIIGPPLKINWTMTK